jgi:hypothetical protein
MPLLWRVDAMQAHTELGAIPCDESHCIPIGYLLDESLDGADAAWEAGENTKIRKGRRRKVKRDRGLSIGNAPRSFLHSQSRFTPLRREHKKYVDLRGDEG